MSTPASRKVTFKSVALASAAAFSFFAVFTELPSVSVNEAQAGQRAGSINSSRTSSRARSGNRQYIARRNHINRYNNRVVIQNHLQSQRRSGAVLANPRYLGNGAAVVLNPYRDHRRSGVVHRGNRQDRLYRHRLRDRARYNDRVVVDNYLQSQRRSNSVLANPRYSYGGSVLYDGGYAVGGGNANGVACPKNHNCGYRIYSNGSGPRIITPGVGPGNGLPAYDGVSGPQIITLD
ncbi:MAG: hypothetical protein AAF478_13020 [Pseudomonadota bacterium]